MKLTIQILLAMLCFLSACTEEKEDALNTNVVYFLVAETEVVHGESYILPLTKPDDIAQARELIAHHTPKIVVAEISQDPTDPYPVNRDLTGLRTWSWHVTEFLGFTDMSIEILDGWPSYVEENYDEWVANTKGANEKGRIGFWNYTVVREVGELELMEKLGN